MYIENPIIGIFIIVIIFMGIGILYGKFMSCFGERIHRLIQELKSNIK